MPENLEKYELKEKREKSSKHRERHDSSSSSSVSSRSRSRSRGHHSSRKSRNHRKSSRASKTRSRRRSVSRSPSYHRRIRYYGTRENPYKSRVVGIFGLSTMTNEARLMEIFAPFGSIEHVSIIHDAKTGNSRGFGFIYYAQINQASLARRECNGMNLDGKVIRVDYSITKRAHTPTPGVYMGTRSCQRSRSRSYNSSHRRRSHSYRGRSLYHRSRSHSR